MCASLRRRASIRRSIPCPWTGPAQYELVIELLDHVGTDRGWEQAGDDRHTRAGALERLLPLLDKLGRSDEADTLEAADDQREKAARSVAQVESAGAEKIPFVGITPKIGRNDPCPCGSGKKYRKCCLEKPVAVRSDDEEKSE